MEFNFSDELKAKYAMQKSMSDLKLASSGFNRLAPEGATYVDAMKGIDSRAQMSEALTEFSKANVVELSLKTFNLQKAQSIGGLAAGGTDTTLIPIYVDPAMADLTRRHTPLLELIPRVTQYGNQISYNQLTARGVFGWAAEGAALTSNEDTYVRQTTAIKYCYAVGQITGPYLAASKPYLSQGYVDGLNLEIRNKTQTLKYVEEDSLINGDGTSGRSTGYGGKTYVAGLEPDGMRKLITTNAVDESSAAVSFSLIRTLIRRAKTANASTTLGVGDPNLLVTDYTTKDNLKSLMTPTLRYEGDTYELPFGIKAMQFDGLPVLATKFMPDAANTREILVLSTDTWQNRVMQDMTYEELAKTGDSYKFLVKQYLAPITVAEQFNARGYNFA